MGCVCNGKRVELNSLFTSKNPNTTIMKSPLRISCSTFVRELDKHPNDTYEKLNILGRGSYGKVYLVRNKKTQIKYAMKIIKKELIENIESVNEINILKNLDHQNILKIYEYHIDNMYIYIV